jgi:hypothetical protein
MTTSIQNLANNLLAYRQFEQTHRKTLSDRKTTSIQPEALDALALQLANTIHSDIKNLHDLPDSTPWKIAPNTPHLIYACAPLLLNHVDDKDCAKIFSHAQNSMYMEGDYDGVAMSAYVATTINHATHEQAFPITAAIMNKRLISAEVSYQLCQHDSQNFDEDKSLRTKLSAAEEKAAKELFAHTLVFEDKNLL